MEKYGKGEENHHFWKNFSGGTDTKQSGTGTVSVLSTGTGTQCSFLDKCSYYGHNLGISYPICVSQVFG